MKSIRNIFGSLFILGGFVASFSLLHAQETIAPDQSIQALTDVEVMLQALESTMPTPAKSLPRSGTFWSAQHAPGSRFAWPPLPSNFGLSAWPMGDGHFILDDRQVDYFQIQAAAEAEAALTAAASPRRRTSMMASSLASSYAYGNPVYLTNMVVSSAGYQPMTASFSIAGGTNFVPYDILMTSNLLNKVADWNWLGIGYTANNYTFSNQPASQAFYILAKPFKTMTVVWGINTYSQCNVPLATTNAIQVAGGDGHSLALLNDGKILAWGANDYGQANVPTNLIGVAMIAAGWYHSVALLTNGTVTAWGLNGALLGWHLTEVPGNATNVSVISAQALHTLALHNDGTVVAWGYDGFGEASVPSGLSNVVAIASGYQHNLAVNSNGTVVAWGHNNQGQCTIPAGLSNVVDVAAGSDHSLALLKNGTVVAWGSNDEGESSVPAGLTNVVAIAAGGSSFYDTAYSMALKNDGSVVVWGDDDAVDPVGGLNNVIGIAAGTDYALAVRTGPPTPVITLEPADQYQVGGSNATFTARGAGLYGVTYQWQTNGVNLSGATNAALILTNVQATQIGSYKVVVSDNGGMGGIASSNANFYLVTPPVITSQTLPTNQVCIYGNHLSFAITATAPYQTNGFPLTYQWQFNGTNIGVANTNSYGFYVTDNSSGTYSVIVANAAGNVSASWQVTVTNAINVTNDLLLIYNTNSTNSIALKDYYLAHRPMVGGANVLGVACDANEIIALTNCDAQIVAPVLNWLTNNPAKRPQYVVLFFDMPTRIQPVSFTSGSVGYHLQQSYSGWQPFVTYINGGTVADCEAYVDKIACFGTNYSPGKLVISASAGGYGNTNYYFDDTESGYGGYGAGLAAKQGVIQNGVSSNSVVYTNVIPDCGSLACHITSGTNVGGYLSWGGHSALGLGYATNGFVNWTGNSRWWIIETVESFNGQRYEADQGNFIKWLSSNAFGGTNYLNTPVGAVCHTEEPGSAGTINNESIYFGEWAAGKSFAICAWDSIVTRNMQAVGDPFVTR